MALELAAHPRGCLLPVRAQPGARRSGIVGEHGGALKIAVTAAPVRGKANDALIEVLGAALGIKKAQIELLGGQTAKTKRFLIVGIEPAELARRLAARERGEAGKLAGPK